MGILLSSVMMAPEDGAPREGAPTYWLARFWFLRGMGFVYLIGFLVLINQYKPLLGSDGLYPVPIFLDTVRSILHSGLQRFLTVPSLFWLNSSDAFVLSAAWIGLLLSLLVVAGISNAAVMAAVWILYTSFAHIGQLFYGYGWETMMIEAGFLAIFLCPIADWRPFPEDSPPPDVVIWMLRWMLFRLMFGAGLIKLRGDPCWRYLTCLYYHFETQPIPNPLSWYFHQLPHWILKIGVVFNHFTEIVAPWLAFSPAPWRTFGGLSIVSFQIFLILSGNLSWLNWLTIVIAIACFDDRTLGRWLPMVPASSPPGEGKSWKFHFEFQPLQDRLDMRKLTPRTFALYALCVLVGILSIPPAVNLLSPRQIMNGSFDPIGLVNAYGAFGTIGRERMEVVLEGTDDPKPDESARWREYEFKCAPGDLHRRPCVVAPYQERIDWQIWFAGFETPQQNPWLVHFIYKLLKGNAGALGLLGSDPFAGKPPKYIRATLYRYRFAEPGSAAWWTRERIGAYLPPLSLDDPMLAAFMRDNGWDR